MYLFPTFGIMYKKLAGFRGRSPLKHLTGRHKKWKSLKNMYAKWPISRNLATKVSTITMEQQGHYSVSEEQIQAEWQEIRAAQRDRMYFKPLYERYFEPIYRYLFKRTADNELTNDLCQQVFLKAMQKLDSYTFKGVPFSAWLYRIAANELAMYYRKNQRQRVVSIELTDFLQLREEIQPLSDETDPREALIYALDQLKESDLEIVELRFFEHRPFREIADMLDITESNAKVRTYRALDRLKKHYNNYKAPQKDLKP